MNNNPIVSVLMTCYNREKYIGEAIESVLISTYKNLELIVVDDCSSDKTVAIAKKFAEVDDRVKIFTNHKNLGDYPNRNRAASLASGKYIKYVDSDDCITPSGLTTMVNSMEKFPLAAIGLVSSNAVEDRAFPFMLQPKESYEYHFFGPGLFHMGPLSAIFSAEAFKAVGGFYEERMTSDIDMWYRMGLQFPVVVLPNGLVWQRRHPEQELSDQKDFIYSGEKIKWKYLLDPECELSVEQIKKIRKMRMKRYTGFILSGLSKGNFRQVRTYLKCYFFVSKLQVSK